MAQLIFNKEILLVFLNDPLNKNMADVARSMNIDIQTLYFNKDRYRICKKNGKHISLGNW